MGFVPKAFEAVVIGESAPATLRGVADPAQVLCNSLTSFVHHDWNVDRGQRLCQQGNNPIGKVIWAVSWPDLMIDTRRGW